MRPTPPSATRLINDLSRAAPAPTLRYSVGLWRWRHGLWAPVFGLVIAAAAWLLWDADRLRRLASSVPTAEVPMKPLPSTADNETAQAASRLKNLREVLTAQRESTQLVRRLVQITQPEMAWQRAQFQQSEDAGLGLVRLQITVPVQGRYRQVRAAVNRALLDMPNLSLDQVVFQREKASNTELEAQLRFSLWLLADRGALAAAEARR